jgi:hypothetical protein
MFSIPVYIGISTRFNAIAHMTANSIRENTSRPVDIHLLYPDTESGCTGFSDVRYTIRCGIYLDVDMVVLGDIAELWAYRQRGKFVCMHDGSTEVAVIDCVHDCRNKHEQGRLPKACTIPPEWNSEDTIMDGAKLVHYTNLNTQPWTHGPHPDAAADALWRQYV